MTGKKKKSLANKLAKMSDEERARYLQHRAEIEEEAKRRKEQLVATFMKKKIKKEEAFARLNQSKINQNWHQILRKIKVQGMREEVTHLRKWIDRVVNYKNRNITKLLDQLEAAEIHYTKNFTTHATHIDEMIEDQNQYINKLQNQYQEELNDLRDTTQSEQATYLQNSITEIEYLKTVIFGQTEQASTTLNERQEYYNQQLYECDYNNRAKLLHLKKTRGETESAIWFQILSVVKLYVQRTDTRRSHLAELKRIDSESAVEIRNNQERIKKYEQSISLLKATHAELLQHNESRIQYLEIEEKSLNKKFLMVKQQLKNYLEVDEKQMRFLVATSNEVFIELNKILEQGQHLLALSDTCRKFETHREKVAKYLPFFKLKTISSEITENTEEEAEVITTTLTDDEKLYQLALAEGFSIEKYVKPSISKNDIDVPAPGRTRSRPKTGALPKNSAKSTAENASIHKSEISTPEKLKAIEDIIIEAKKIQDEADESPSSSNYEEDDVLKKCYENLKNMENFWFMYNKVEVDVMEIKEEKRILAKQNKQLRGFIRAVLESAAMAKSIPESRISTRVPSKRSVQSAPLRRIIF